MPERLPADAPADSAARLVGAGHERMIGPPASYGPDRLPSGTHPTVLLYDWDNTLVDGWAAITAALNAVFAEFRMPSWTIEDTRSRVRVALRESFPLMFGASWEQARDLFYASFRDGHLDHLRPMQGAAEALEAGGVLPQGVVSNKAGRYLRAEVAHLGWSGHFRAVVGAGDAAADKPDPAPIHLALQQLGHRAGASVWYLGDTALDMQAARAAGVTAVLIGDAGHDGGIAHAAPDIHFPSAYDLAAHFRALA
ncbi:MAG TPA: HAD family hydrolase [Acetobacteraceae bacterium]|nr:HAD family hydrolase [Acetobacteraceae bacterium]